MAHSITGKLNKPASEFQAGESIGFGIRLGEQHYDRETQQKAWTNYEGVVFAKAPQQIQYYRDVLTEGSVIEISCKQLKIKEFNGQNGTMHSLEMIDCDLGYTHSSIPNGQQQAPQHNYQQAPQQPQQAPQGYAQSQPLQHPPQQSIQHGGYNQQQPNPNFQQPQR